MRNVIAWIAFNKTTDSNKIEVIVLDDQKTTELRRIREMGLAVYLDDCTILQIYTRMRTWRNDEQIAEKKKRHHTRLDSSAVLNIVFERE